MLFSCYTRIIPWCDGIATLFLQSEVWYTIRQILNKYWWSNCCEVNNMEVWDAYDAQLNRVEGVTLIRG